MASVLTTPQQTTVALQETRGERFRLIAGLLIALSVLFTRFGSAWDINWHSDVGPDTFFTLPHVFLYVGTALGGVTCLVAVLYSTWTYRQGQPLFPHTSLTSLGIFRAPFGFILGGFGALIFFFYGLFDEFWHSIYGFDAVLRSPPHVGLFLSNFIAVAGCVSIFAGAKSKTVRLLGSAFAVGTTLIAMVVSLQSLGRRGLPEIAIALLFTFSFILAMSLVKQRGAALFAALTVTLYQLLLWYVIPPVTQAYADSLGLFLREYVSGNSVVAVGTPLFGLVATGVLETLFWFGRKRNWSVRISVIGIGIIASLIMLLPVQYLYNTKAIMNGSLSFFPPVRSVVTVMVLGGAFSYLAWLLGSVIRRKAQ